MPELTFTELRKILIAAAGDSQAGAIDESMATTAFTELGYDSLALLEMAARIEQRYGVHLDDDDVTQLPTPTAVMDRVNRELARGTR